MYEIKSKLIASLTALKSIRFYLKYMNVMKY